MWVSKILGKTRENGALILSVLYTDGVTEFYEKIDMTGGDGDVLNNKIALKLKALNTDDSSFPSNGDFTPIVRPPAEKEIYFQKLRKFEQLARLSDLGIIKQTDQIFIDALAEAKLTFKPEYYV